LALNGVNAQAIHGGMEQNKRTRVLKGFDSEKVNVMVCTDVAARGLDIQGVSHVYNYDLPKDHKDYIHRIGRTARAGAEGIAVNILASRDYDAFSNIQRHNAELVIKRVDTPHYERIFVKWDAPKGRGLHGRSARGGSGGRGPRRGKPDRRGKQHERNKRKKSKDGFRGGGRNTKPRRGRH